MWYQIMSACVNVGLAWQDQWMSNRINKKSLRAAAKTAEYKAKMEQADFDRRTQYRNEELGQQVWNIMEQSRELSGLQNAAMGASGFDVSTGDQRILRDTTQRALDKVSGINRTYYLQQFEDEKQTQNNILQYNFEAWANRQQVKNYSGISGFAKIVDAGGRAFVNSAPGLFQGNQKGGISSNTGAQDLSWMKGVQTTGWGASMANTNAGRASALGDFSSIASSGSYGKLSGFNTLASSGSLKF